MKRLLLGVALILILAALLVMLPVSGPLLYNLLLGWLIFSWNTLPQVSLRWDGLVTFGVGLLLLIAVSHAFLRWLMRHLTAEGEASSRGWQLQWTICGTAIVLLLFVAGIALVGITHQLAWMARTPEGMIVPRIQSDAGQFTSSGNLIQIYLGVSNYHGTYRALPRPAPAFVADADQPPQSWITKISPFMFHILPEEHDRSKPWNSPRNRAVFERVQPEFLNAELPTATGHNAEGYGVSHYAGNDQLLGNQPVSTLEDTSQTLLVGEINANFSPWGEPGANIRPPVMHSAEIPGFGGPAQRDTVLFLTADGRIKPVSKEIDPEVLRALGTPGK